MADIILGNIRGAKPGSPENRMCTFDAEIIEATQDLVEQEAPGASEIVNALQEVIASGKVIEHHQRKGLVVATGPKGRDGVYTIEGLMYVEETEGDRFTTSAANVSVWVGAIDRFMPAADYLRNRSMTSTRRDDIRRKFYGTALTNVDELHTERGHAPGHFSLVTRSSTLITPVGNQDGDIQFPFHHGDWRDALRVAGLDLPDPLKQTVIASVMGHHATQRLDANLAETG